MSTPFSSLLLAALLVTVTAHQASAAAPGSSNPYRLDPRYRLTEPNDARPYAREIALAARQAALDPELVHAVIAVESGYQAQAISPRGAVGLMQVLPETARRYGIDDARDISSNLRAGTRHLGVLMERFDNRLELALAAYNAGEGAVRQHGNSIPPYPETRDYVPAVLARYRARNPRAAAPAASGAARTYLAGTRLDGRALRGYR